MIFTLLTDPKQICADDSTLYCASSIEACVGVNEIFKIPICTTQCEPGQVRLGADTEPAVAQDICVGKHRVTQLLQVLNCAALSCTRAGLTVLVFRVLCVPTQAAMMEIVPRAVVCSQYMRC
jgi:hypothetical protein